jgi:hypothetical protein
MLRVLSALHYAHTFVKSDGKPLAVIHRDVSPTNILLDISGNVKLVDFGIARAEGDAEVYKTEAPQLRGKFGYLAPELFTGEPPTPQSDVYAAGVVLYELLTGDNPFRGREVTDSYHKVLNVVAPDISSLRSDVSTVLAKVVETALSKSPADRYASAAAFADALRPERPAPDEACQGRLRAAVQAAFAGPLADTLGIEPLSDADEAWREGADEGVDQSLETAVHEPPQTVTPGSRVADKRASPSPSANVPGSPRPQRQSLADELGPALEEMGEEPTVRRAPPQSSLPPLRPTHLRLVAIASASLIGAFLVAGILRTLEHKEDRVIVIERESNTPEPDAPPPTAAQEPDLQPLHDTQRASPELAPKAKAAAARQQSSAPAPAVGPEPARLTSAFAHQQSRIARCFASHADAVQPLPELTIEFQVDASGAVERAELSPASAAGSALGTCLIDVAKSTRFPRLTRAVTFRIPIQAHVAQPAE